MRSSKPSPVIPEPPWPLRRPRTSSGAAISSMRPARPTGPTAIGSCCRAATPRCCSTRCCISRDTTSRLTTSSSSGNGDRRHRDIPNAATPPGSRPPPARSARASAMRSGWRSPNGFSRQQYNRPGLEVVNHRTWVFASDGDMMEGVASEASSLAGHLQLGKLTVVYDDNRITIDGHHRHLVYRRCRHALRGVWLARAARR